MRAYAESSNRPVFPRFATPGAAASFWFLVVLLFAGSALAWAIQVPMTVSGMTLVTGGPDEDQKAVTILVILPPDHAADVHAGDEVVIRFGTFTDIQPLVSVVDGPFDPDQLRARFGLDVETARAIPAESRIGVVVVADLPHAYPEMVGDAAIQVGIQRLSATLPVIGRFFS
jgi:hypothetical protein